MGYGTQLIAAAPMVVIQSFNIWESTESVSRVSKVD